MHPFDWSEVSGAGAGAFGADEEEHHTAQSPNEKEAKVMFTCEH